MCFSGQHSGFLLFGRNIHLHQYIQRWQASGALFAQAAGNFVTVNGFYPLEVFGDGTRLVGLQRADKMPFNIGQMAEGGDFVHAVLQVVFTKAALAEGVDSLDHRCGFGLTDRKQAYTLSRAVVLCTGLLQALQHILVIQFKSRHFRGLVYLFDLQPIPGW